MPNRSYRDLGELGYTLHQPHVERRRLVGGHQVLLPALPTNHTLLAGWDQSRCDGLAAHLCANPLLDNCREVDGDTRRSDRFVAGYEAR